MQLKFTRTDFVLIPPSEVLFSTRQSSPIYLMLSPRQEKVIFFHFVYSTVEFASHTSIFVLKKTVFVSKYYLSEKFINFLPRGHCLS